MNNRFKIPRFIGGTLYFIYVVLIIFELIPALYSLIINGDLPAHTNVFSIIPFFIIIYLSIALNKMEYFLSNEKILIRNLFEKDKIYSLDEIERIEEAGPLFSHIKIYISSKKRPLILVLGNIEGFIDIILKTLKIKRKISFDKNDKVIIFSKL